jgi:ATP-dependent helicase HrpB
MPNRNLKNLPQLPIQDIIPDVKKHLQSNSTLILHAPPGAGKSTILPLVLMEEDWLKGKKILMLEPRRLAASSIARRMASLLGEQPGEAIGYRIRFDKKIGPNTKVEVITEGILTRMVHSDNALEEVGLVVFDEFHERSIHADLGLALCLEIQKFLRPELRILVMSATLDTRELSETLKSTPLESKGKQYPVDIIYYGNTDLHSLPEMISHVIGEAVENQAGDVLAFLPGQGEIKKAYQLLINKFPELAIYTLYGNLPFSKQQAALLPHPDGKRKIVLATSIAETSLTIEGVKVVVDSGFTRTSQFDPKTGLNGLKTLPITQDAASQRAGRAGRLAPGTCYRLWSKAAQEKLFPYRKPEILEADLTSLALELAKWGVKDPEELSWITPPPTGSWLQAMDTLQDLNAIENGRITGHGEAIHALPCHPRIAHMLIFSKEYGEEALATDLAALLEEKDPLLPPAGVDINFRIEALRRYRSHSYKNRTFGKIEKIASIYRNILKSTVDNGPVDPTLSGLLLAHTFPERIASARPGNQAQFQLANGKIARMDARDELAHEPWIAIAHLDAKEGMGKIFMAAPLDPKDLRPLIKVRHTIKWDDLEDKVTAKESWRIGQIILQNKVMQNPDDNLVKLAVLDAIKKQGEKLLDFNEQFTQLQHRILSLSKWNPGEPWPEVQTRVLLENPEEWLGPYLDPIKSGEALRRINLKEVLQSTMSYDLQRKLQSLAPVHLGLPSGSQVKLKYFSDGEPPVLSARLQELFGWKKTPTINDGKVQVLIHLLSPGFKPVQVTQDLENFWNDTYHEVKKEMKRRYPKHYWPENPWEAQATKGVKRQKP